MALVALALLLIQSACSAALSHTEVYHTYLLLKIESNRSRAQVGESIHIRFTTRNTGNEIIIIESKELPVMDVVVGPYGSDEVFLAWSELNPDKISHQLAWKPGESKIIELTWTPKQGEVWFGAPRYVRLSGLLSSDSKIVKSVGLMICASNTCQ